jgi:hypothetical protein
VHDAQLQLAAIAATNGCNRIRLQPCDQAHTAAHCTPPCTTQGSARRYNQIPLAGWMWWAYNENSGDTGGIVHNDWQDLHWAKLRYMMDYLGLTPWYKTSDAGRSPRTPSPVAPNPPPRQPPSGSGRQPPVRRPGAGSGAGRRPRNPRDATDRPRMPREGRTRGRLQRRRQHRRPSPRARMAAAGFAASTQL